MWPDSAERAEEHTLELLMDATVSLPEVVEFVSEEWNLQCPCKVKAAAGVFFVPVVVLWKDNDIIEEPVVAPENLVVDRESAG